MKLINQFFSKKGNTLMLFFLFSTLILANEPEKKIISISLKDITIERLFNELEAQTSVKFLYNSDVISSKEKFTISEKNLTLEQILDKVLSPRKLSFLVKGDHIVVKRSIESIVQTSNKKASNYVIQGKVTDNKGEPLIGATIVITGVRTGTITDYNGKFVIKSPTAEGEITASYMGYKSQMQKYDHNKDVIIKLKEDSKQVEEVTVVGYGTRKKREVVGAISSIKADDIKDAPSANLETILQGRMAGMSVTQQSGSPGGGGSSMAIRGYNSLLDDEAGYKSSGSPLYIIDGVPMHSFTSPVTGTNTISEIDPSIIESVEVLKDAASAAIYGSRAANGIILITTKKGREGRAKFSANVSYSTSELPVAPQQMGGKFERDHYIRMAKATRGAYYDKTSGLWKYPTSYEEAALNGVDFDLFWKRGDGIPTNGNMAMVQDSLNPFYNNSTNWYKYIFRKGQVMNANIQASGASENMSYMLSGGIYKETGIMPGSDFLRGNVISNISVKPIKNLTIDNRIYLAYTDRSRGRGGVGGGMYESMTIEPEFTSTLLPSGGTVESKILQMMNGQSEINTSYRLRGNMVFNYQIIEGLTISSSFAIDFNQANQNFFRPSYLDYLYFESKSAGQIMRDMLLSNENIINYNFSKRDHNFDIMGGVSFDGNKIWSISGFGLGGPSDNVQYVSNSFVDMVYDDVSGFYRALMEYRSDFTETAMSSYFGRIAYNFDEKYLTEFTLRADGSSVFGPEERWAIFPSIAGGWAFSKEKFMKRAWWLDFGKVRVSWGQTGSQFGIPYLAQGLMSPGYKFDGIQGMKPEGVINRKLKWEQSDQVDIGLDLEMFDYRLTLALDYYYKYTHNLIYRVPMPGDMYGDANMQWQNALAVSNEGYEMEAKLDILRDTQVKWRTRLNMSHNKNKFLKSYSGYDISGKMVLGKSMSGIYLYKDEGYIQTENDIPFYFDEEGKKHFLSPDGDDASAFIPGMKKIADLNGDGVINEDDMYYAGTSLPLLYGGWANELKWKNFDLTLFFVFNLGRKMVNTFRDYTVSPSSSGLKPIFTHLDKDDFWQNVGDDTKFPGYGIYNAGALQYSGLFASNLENVHYCKLKQLTIGYTLPNKISKKIGLSSLRAFATGENLLTLTNYSGLDPEVVSIHNGIDGGASYPLSRKWTIGLTVNF